MILSYLKSKSFLLPTAMTTLFIILCAVLLLSGQVKYYTLDRMLVQWDGQHYLTIASDGYEKHPCGWDGHYICGNIGWFPALPMISRVISLLGVESNWSLIITSWLSLWLGCLLLFTLVKRNYNFRVALFTLGALFLFPGSFYFLTAYPNALYFLLTVLLFYLVETNRLHLLWLPASGLAVTHPSGSVIGLALIYLFIKYWRAKEEKKRNWVLVAMVSMGLSLFLYFSYYYFRFDDFLLYVHHQSQPYYAHQMTLPFIPIAKLFANPSVDWPNFTMFAFVLGAVLFFYRREVKTSWQVFMFALLLFSPTMGTTDSYFRYVQAAFPLYLMIGLSARTRWGKYLYVLYAIVSVTLMWTVFLNSYKLGLMR